MLILYFDIDYLVSFFNLCWPLTWFKIASRNTPVCELCKKKTTHTKQLKIVQSYILLRLLSPPTLYSLPQSHRDSFLSMITSLYLEQDNLVLKALLTLSERQEWQSPNVNVRRFAHISQAAV